MIGRSIFYSILLLTAWAKILGYDITDNDDLTNAPIVMCHAYQVAPLGDPWDIIYTDDRNCSNHLCLMIWGLTPDKRVVVLAQGCSKGALTKQELGASPNPMRNMCPSGTDVGPGKDEPVLHGPVGEDVLDTIAYASICACQTNFCNSPPIPDGGNCSGQPESFVFCHPKNGIVFREPRNYSIHKTTSPPFTEAYTELEPIAYVAAAVVILVIVCSLFTLFFALLRKGCFTGKGETKCRHTSGRLNSIAQVTILTEVAQGYKQEAEELVRDSQDGGKSEIANWKYDESVKLGTGSFGAVYKVDMKAEYLVEAKVAALKTFSHMRSTHFFNESRTLKYVHDFKNHPNIIQYLGRAVDCRDTLEEATWRIALEVCEGGSLRDWLTASPCTLNQYLEAASGLLSALAFLHSEESVQTSLLSNIRGSSVDSGNPDSRSNSRSRRSSKAVVPIKKKFRIAHCDINSRNILVRNPMTGNVVLADFGLALTDRERRQEEVQIREIGTIRYLAPEMLQGLINLSDTLNSLIQVDTYATGLVLWEILSRTEEMYEKDSELPPYSAPFERELQEMGDATANRFEAMRNVVVRRSLRPAWAGKAKEWREKEDETMERNEESTLTDEEKFLLMSVEGINSMLARDPDARMTIAAMGEKVDTMRLKCLRMHQKVSRDDSMMDDTSGSN